MADRAESWYVSHAWDDTHRAWIPAHSHTHAHQYSCMCMWFWVTLHSFLWSIELKVGMWVTHRWTHIVRELQLTHTLTHTNTAICICDFDRLYTVFCGRSSWKLVCESHMGRHTSCVNFISLTHTRIPIQLYVYVILSDYTVFYGRSWPIKLKIEMWVTHGSTHIVREFQLTHTHTHTNTALCVCDFDRLYTFFCSRSSWKLVCE